MDKFHWFVLDYMDETTGCFLEDYFSAGVSDGPRVGLN
jgi:hypothetical protein